MDPLTIGVIATNLLGFGLNMKGQSDANSSADKREKKIIEQQQETYDYWYDEDDGEAYRQRDFSVDQIDRDLRNFMGNAQTQLDNLTVQRGQEDDMKKYGYMRNMEAYNQVVDQTNEQLDRNDQALNRAFGRQDNFVREAQLKLEFEGRKDTIDFIDQKDKLGLRTTQNKLGRTYNYRGNRLNQQKADLTIRSQRADAAFKQQDAIIQGLKSTGKAQASGLSGRGAGKLVQATMAENGAKRAVISEQTALNGQQYMLSTKENVMNLQKLNDEFMLENSKISQALQVLDSKRALDLDELQASYTSLERKDQQQREDYVAEYNQANAAAIAQVPLMPDLGPLASDFPMPEIYIPEVSYPLEVNPPPFTPLIGSDKPSPFMAGLPNLLQAIPAIAGGIAKANTPNYSGTTNLGNPGPGMGIGGGGYGAGGGGLFN